MVYKFNYIDFDSIDQPFKQSINTSRIKLALDGLTSLQVDIPLLINKVEINDELLNPFGSSEQHFTYLSSREINNFPTTVTELKRDDLIE